MIYISKLELENFQSHKYTLLDFDKGLNVIVGNSDSGKTAIIRAIKWALYNEPQGDYFIRQGEKNTSVSVHFNTGAIVKRFRSPSKNSYYLKKSNGEEFYFEGFGRIVPKEISEEINMYKINLDESTNSIINIAEQLEGPFLLNEKNSIRASAIGRLVGVNFIDDALRETIRDSKSTTSDIKTLEDRREFLSEKLKEFDYLSKKEEILAKLKNLKFKLDTKIDKYNSLIKLLQKFKSIEFEIDNELRVIEKHKNLDTILNIYNKLTLKYFKYKNLSDINKKILFNSEEINKNKKWIKKLENLDLYENTIDTISQKTKFYKEMTYQKNKYDLCLVDIENQNKILNLLSNLNAIEEIYNQANVFLMRLNIFQNFFTNYEDLSNRIEVGKSFCLKYNDLDEIENILKILDKVLIKYDFLKNSKINLDSLKQNISKSKEEYLKFDKNIKLNYKSYQNEMLHIGQCPLCFSKIDNEVIENIRKRYVEE
ncbi:chromosome segregation protein [Peptoniphilus sp. ING2-D1G]|nr:chromosome segregation protein [Peptoniphilus sp. ING2-D1G]